MRYHRVNSPFGIILFIIFLLGIVSVIFLPDIINDNRRSKLEPIPRVDYINSEVMRAEPELEYYYYSIDEDYLSDDVMLVIDAISKGEKEVWLSDDDSSYVDRVAEQAKCAISTMYLNKCVASTMSVSRNGSFHLKIFYDDNQLMKFQKAQDEAARILDELGIAYLTDLGVIKSVYEYIVLHTDYDHDAAEQGIVDDNARIAYGALIEGSAVCSGYSHAYALVLNMAGIETRYISSTVLKHAWNMIELDGAWYHADTTYGECNPNIQGYVSYIYFMKNDAYMEDFEEGRAQSDIEANSPSYYFDTYSTRIYNSDDGMIAMVQEGDNLYKYGVTQLADGYAIDRSSQELMVENVLSWCIKSDYPNYIVYNDLLGECMCMIDGGKRYRAEFRDFDAGYLVSAEKSDSSYRLVFVKDMMGEPYEVNTRVHKTIEKFY